MAVKVRPGFEEKEKKEVFSSQAFGDDVGKN